MLTHPTVDKLHQLRCAGMAKAVVEQLGSSEVEALSFEERLGLIVDRELTERASRQLTNRLRRARLRHAACIEDIDFRQPRGLDRDLVLSLADGRWVRDHLNVLDHRPGRRGKELDILRPRPQRVPQRIQRLVPAPPTVADRTGHRARRRTLCEAARLARQDQRAGHRRLGGVEAQRREPTRPARNHRGPPWTELHHRDLAVARGELARRDRRSRPWPTPSSTGSSTTPTNST